MIGKTVNPPTAMPGAAVCEIYHQVIGDVVSSSVPVAVTMTFYSNLTLPIPFRAMNISIPMTMPSSKTFRPDPKNISD